MGQLSITCACGNRGTYHAVWVPGYRLFSEDSVIIWHDPKVEFVKDLKLSVQRNVERGVYRCLSCAFEKQKLDEKLENDRRDERIKRKAEELRLKREKAMKNPSLFIRIFGKKES